MSSLDELIPSGTTMTLSSGLQVNGSRMQRPLWTDTYYSCILMAGLAGSTTAPGVVRGML